MALSLGKLCSSNVSPRKVVRGVYAQIAQNFQGSYEGLMSSLRSLHPPLKASEEHESLQQGRLKGQKYQKMHEGLALTAGS